MHLLKLSHHLVNRLFLLLFFRGRGDNIRAWMEFRYAPGADFPHGGSVDLEEEGLTPGLISILGEPIPPGGSLMIIYGAEEHPIHSETEWGLKRRFPPPATPLGFYLWENGFRWFKDWYFPEGWMEGGMKLQATRPITESVRRELQDFEGIRFEPIDFKPPGAEQAYRVVHRSL